MKRNTINRRGASESSQSSQSSQSAMVETLESRRMFCYAPVNTPIAELMEQATAEQPLASREWTGLNRAEQTSGHSDSTGAGPLS